MAIKHYLITRFNVPINFMLTKQLEAIDITRDEQYLDKRFKLFAEYTVPSVSAQTFKEFVWYIFFSEHTPQKYRPYIAELAANNHNFIPVYLKTAETYTSYLKNVFAKENAETIVQTRIDNDDAINITFIENVQNYVRKQDCNKNEYVLVFLNGVQYEYKNKILSKYIFPNNHFNTLVTINNGVNTKVLFDYNHMKIDNYFEVISIDNEKPMWLEGVHESNISNRMHTKANSILVDMDLGKEFGLTKLESERNKFKADSYIRTNKFRNAIRLFRQYGIKKTFAKLRQKIADKKQK